MVTYLVRFYSICRRIYAYICDFSFTSFSSQQLAIKAVHLDGAISAPPQQEHLKRDTCLPGGC